MQVPGNRLIQGGRGGKVKYEIASGAFQAVQVANSGCQAGIIRIIGISKVLIEDLFGKLFSESVIPYGLGYMIVVDHHPVPEGGVVAFTTADAQYGELPGQVLFSKQIEQCRNEFSFGKISRSPKNNQKLLGCLAHRRKYRGLDSRNPGGPSNRWMKDPSKDIFRYF